jgi:hypothetical protein
MGYQTPGEPDQAPAPGQLQHDARNLASVGAFVVDIKYMIMCCSSYVVSTGSAGATSATLIF